MRVIKFRAKQNDGSEWHKGEIHLTAKIPHIHPYGEYTFSYAIDKNTIGQYIGIKDSFGTEIFEGDIITVNGKYPKLIAYREDSASFCCANVNELENEGLWDIWQHPDTQWWAREHEIKVVGNKFDNPEKITKEYWYELLDNGKNN